MIYLLDTNILTYLEETSSSYHDNVKSRLSQLNDDDQVCISVITMYELYYSISAITAKDEVARLKALICSFEARFPVIPLDKDGAEQFGIIKASYRKQTGINQKALDRHNVDFIIAGSAIAKAGTLVSNDNIFNDVKRAVPELVLENWAVNE